MAYNQNIPDAALPISQSRESIEDNFKAIKTVVDVNHKTFGDPNQGKHALVTLPETTAPTTLLDEVALYAKAESKLYLRLENNGAEFNLTPSAAGLTASGYEVLPSGLIINWGYGVANDSTHIVFAKAFTTSASNVFSIQLTYAISDHHRRFIYVKPTFTHEYFIGVALNTDSIVTPTNVYFLAVGK